MHFSGSQPHSRWNTLKHTNNPSCQMFLIGTWCVVSSGKGLSKQKVLHTQKILDGGRNQWQECITGSQESCYLKNNILYLRQMLNFKQTLLLLWQCHSSRRGWHLIPLQLHPKVGAPSPTGAPGSAAWVSGCTFQKEIWAPGKIQAYFTTGKHMLTCNSNWAGILWEVLVILFRFDILLFTNITRMPKKSW